MNPLFQTPPKISREAPQEAPQEAWNRRSYRTPHKRLFAEEASPSTPEKVQRISEEALSLLPDLDTFTKTDFGHPEVPNVREMPVEPKKSKPRDDRHVSSQFLRSEHAWKQITQTPLFREIGKGKYHRVLAHPNQSFVHKLPTLQEADESVQNNKCFRTTAHMQADFKALRDVEKIGLFPFNFHIARTMFNVRDAIITQEKCDRMFEKSDLQDPNFRTALKELFSSGYTGLHNMDLTKKNLGIKDNQLVLIDFREENEESAGTFKSNVEIFLKSISEGDAEIYQYLDPRPKV